MKCKNCNADVLDEAVFCSKCGGRMDGKTKCISCGAMIAEESDFCSFCGTNQKAAEAKPSSVTPPQPRPQKQSGAVSAKIGAAVAKYKNLSIYIFSAILCVVMFGCSFLPVYKLKTTELMGGYYETEVKISTIDIVKAMFTSKDYDEQDFQTYLSNKLKNINPIIYKISRGQELTKKEEKQLKKAFLDINFAKSAYAKESKETNHSMSSVLTTIGIIGIIQMLSCLTFFILILIGILKKWKMRWLLLTFLIPLAAAVSLIAFISQNMFLGFTLSGAVVVPLIMSIIGMLAIFIDTLLKPKSDIENCIGNKPSAYKRKNIIFQAVTGCLAVIMMICASTGIVKATIDTGDKEVNAYFNATDNFMYTDFYRYYDLLDANEAEELNFESDDIYDVILDAFNTYRGTEGLERAQYLTYLYNIYLAIDVPTSIGIVGAIPYFYLASMLTLIGLLCMSVFNITNNKTRKNIVNLILSAFSFVFSLLIVIFSGVSSGLINQTFASGITLSVGPGAIMFLIFATLGLGYSIFLHLYQKKKNKPEIIKAEAVNLNTEAAVPQETSDIMAETAKV